MVERYQNAAKVLTLSTNAVPVRAPNDLEKAFKTIAQANPDGLIIAPDLMFFRERQRIAELSLGNRFPAMAWLGEMVQAGVLMSYGANLPDLFRRAAEYVDKILKGGRPADIPVEQPTKFDLDINLNTAKLLGLTLPQSILVSADKLIQ